MTTFNACAVSDQKCVPQAVSDNYPLPADEVLDDSFDTTQFQGRWYITAGYNKLFDCFDCQEHFFTSPEPGKLFGNIQWRIARPGGDFLERSTVQRFLQVRLQICSSNRPDAFGEWEKFRCACSELHRTRPLGLFGRLAAVCVQDPVHPSKLYNHDNECALFETHNNCCGKLSS